MSGTDLHSEEITPADLVRRIRAGDSVAENLLVRTYQRPIQEMLNYRTRDKELARDLLQDTLLIVIRRLRTDGLEQPEKLAAFMHRTAQNLVVAYFRKEARRNTHSDTDAVELKLDQSPSVLERVLESERSQFVKQLLDELVVDRDRDVLKRFYVWGQAKPEICSALELSHDQFDRVISRARKRFKELILARVKQPA